MPLSDAAWEGWRDEAACRGADPSVMVPDHVDDVAEALTYCARCPVIDECDEYAERNGETHGVWGGRDRTPRRHRGSTAKRAPGGIPSRLRCDTCDTPAVDASLVRGARRWCSRACYKRRPR